MSGIRFTKMHGAGNDFVDGGDHDDRLISLLGYGDDIVRGGAGNDLVTELSGQNLLDGGVGGVGGKASR